MIFLMDCRRHRRVKIWGTARVVENAPEMIETWCRKATAPAPGRDRVQDRGHRRQLPAAHPQMLFVEDVATAIEVLEARIAALEAENARLKGESSLP